MRLLVSLLLAALLAHSVSCWYDEAKGLPERIMFNTVSATINNAAGVFKQVNKAGDPIFKHVSGGTWGMHQISTAGKPALYKPSLFGNAFSGLGKVLWVCSIAMETAHVAEAAGKDYREGKITSTVRASSRAVGGYAGATYGAAAGAAALSFIPGVGTIVGGMKYTTPKPSFVEEWERTRPTRSPSTFVGIGAGFLKAAGVFEQVNWCRNPVFKHVGGGTLGMRQICMYGQPLYEPSNFGIAVSGIGKIVWFSGVAVQAVNVAVAVDRDLEQGTIMNTVHAASQAVGSCIGASFGASVGASMLSFIPDVGPLVGGIAGGYVGSHLGVFAAELVPLLVFGDAFDDYWEAGGHNHACFYNGKH